MRSISPIRRPIKKPVPSSMSFLDSQLETYKLAKLIEEFSAYKEKTLKEFEEAREEIRKTAEEVEDNLADIKKIQKKMDEDFDEVTSEVAGFLKEIKSKAFKGDRGDDGRDGRDGRDGKDGETPEVDIFEIAELAALKVPVPEQKTIKESIEGEEIVPKLNRASNLGDLKLSITNIKDWDKNLSSLRTEISRNRQSYHGGGDTVTAGTNITITTNSNGQKVISASASGANVSTEEVTAVQSGNNVTIDLTQLDHTYLAIMFVSLNGQIINQSRWSIVGSTMTVTTAFDTDALQITYTYA